MTQNINDSTDNKAICQNRCHHGWFDYWTNTWTKLLLSQCRGTLIITEFINSINNTIKKILEFLKSRSIQELYGRILNIEVLLPATIEMCRNVQWYESMGLLERIKCLKRWDNTAGGVGGQTLLYNGTFQLKLSGEQCAQECHHCEQAATGDGSQWRVTRTVGVGVLALAVRQLDLGRAGSIDALSRAALSGASSDYTVITFDWTHKQNASSRRNELSIIKTHIAIPKKIPMACGICCIWPNEGRIPKKRLGCLRQVVNTLHTGFYISVIKSIDLYCCPFWFCFFWKNMND